MRISDWSSDVCSSDLRQFREATLRSVAPAVRFVSSGGWTRTTNQEPWRHEGAWALGCAPLVCRAGGSCRLDRKRVVSGKSVSVRVDLGGRRIIKKKKQQTRQERYYK